METFAVERKHKRYTHKPLRRALRKLLAPSGDKYGRRLRHK